MRLIVRLGNQAPPQRLAGVERDKILDLLRNVGGDLLKRHRAVVERQAIEVRAVDRGEGLQLVDRALLLENGRIAFERVRRVENAGAAAWRFLRLPR